MPRTATTVRGVEDALKEAALEWDSRGPVVVLTAPPVRTGVEVETSEEI